MVFLWQGIEYIFLIEFNWLKCLQVDVFDAAERYRDEKRPVVILAGKEYGSGSSRDWAAKGPFLLVRHLCWEWLVLIIVKTSSYLTLVLSYHPPIVPLTHTRYLILSVWAS